MEFDKPFAGMYTVANGQADSTRLEVTDNHVGAMVRFATRRGEAVNVRVASSFISQEQAELNLKK